MPEDEVAQPSDPEDGQQPAETPASEPEEDASQEPASTEEQTPADEPEEQPAEKLTEDDAKALREQFPDLFPDPEKVRADAIAAAREEAAGKPERVRQNDPLFQAISTQASGAYQRIAQVQQQLAAGEFPEDPDAFLADIDTAGEYQAASERRGQIAVNRAVFEREVGINPDKLDESNPLHKQYGDLLTELETAQQNAYRLRQSAVRIYDPKKRADTLTRAMYMDVTATGDFFDKTLKLAVEHGKALESAASKPKVEKRMAETAKTAAKNGSVEAVARARAVLAGAAGMASAAGNGKPSGVTTYQELLALPQADQAAFIEANPKKYSEMLGIKT